MSLNNIQITTNIVNNTYVITGTMVYLDPDSDSEHDGDADDLLYIPPDIFMYENTGTGIGTYQGVCSMTDYKRMQTFYGTNIPIFGNKYVKCPTATIIIPLSMDPQPIRDKLVADIKTFGLEYLTQQTSTILVAL